MNSTAANSSTLLPIAVSIGETGGIGPDVIIGAWLQRKGKNLSPFYVLGDKALLVERARLLGVDVPVETIEPEEAGAMFQTALPVVPLNSTFSGSPGKPVASDAAGIVEAIETAVSHIKSGRARALVTAPINKKSLYDSGFSYPGHTEFLAHLARGFLDQPEQEIRPVMMLAGPRLRAVPVTIHIPLKDVTPSLTTRDIIEISTITAHDLENRFNLAHPRLAISGINPHAGEEGSMGSEDIAIIQPAVKALRAAGIDARGPLPADTMFHEAARASYDVAICMYHDQALIPAKALDFDRTVNVTLGLPFIRTSPDHGTACEIAGSGKADPTSMIAALKLADELSA